MHFIDVAREIIEEKTIKLIPLMREYHLSESEFEEILKEMRQALILDYDNNIIMNLKDFEKFIDIYEPNLFECNNTVFDKDIFLCIGEIIFDNGVEKTYDCLPPDEVIDYLNIMERLNVISYNSCTNEYELLMNRDDYYQICTCIPDSFASTDYNDSIKCNNTDFDNLNGIEFERLCAYVLSRNDFHNIKITPPSGDHGIDLTATKNDISYAIQCKCYSSNIGNAAVQQAHTGKSLYHCDIAVVLTNQYFTAQAKEEATALGVKLWDRDKLNELIENVSSK